MGFAALRLAVGTLTVLPSGSIGEIDRRTAGGAMLLAPLAVLPLAVAAAGLGWLAGQLGWPAAVSGLLLVAALAVGTRALHLDGLADTVDGLGSGWDRDRALSIMQRGDVGPMGVVALVLVLGLQAVLFGRLGVVESGLAIVVSRAALALVCRRGVPPARPNGLGVAVAGSVPGWAALLSWLLAGTALILAARPWWSGLAGAAAAVLVVVGLVRHCRRRLGGVTGDVMGAAVELALTALLLGLALR